MLNGSSRICGVGFQKTGTTSLGFALERLGYSVANVNKEVNRQIEAGSTDPQEAADQVAIDALKTHHAIQDSPSAFVYKALDVAYPGSKFILTSRPFDQWYASCHKFFPDENNGLRRWMYGVDRIGSNEARYREVYESQMAAIRSYFADRPQDFMEMELSGKVGWYELVNFLGPEFLLPFPHVNVGTGKAGTSNSRKAGIAKRILRAVVGKGRSTKG